MVNNHYLGVKLGVRTNDWENIVNLAGDVADSLISGIARTVALAEGDAALV
jgi:hypothetical protein